MRESLIFHVERRGWKKKEEYYRQGYFPKFSKDPCLVLEESVTLSLSLRQNIGPRSDLSQQNCSSLVTFFFN